MEGFLPLSLTNPSVMCSVRLDEHAGVSERGLHPEPLPRASGVRDAGHRCLAGWMSRLLSAATLSRSHRACGSLNFNSQEAGMTWGPRSSLISVLATLGEMNTGSWGFGIPRPSF